MAWPFAEAAAGLICATNCSKLGLHLLPGLYMPQLIFRVSQVLSLQADQFLQQGSAPKRRIR